MIRQKGFSLIEMTVSTGLVAVIALILGTLMMYATVRFQEVRGRLEAEYTAARAESLLRSYFESAIDVGNGAPGPGNEGGILNFNFNERSDSVDWTLIATFWRETSTQRGGAAAGGGLYGGDPRPTAMWYRRPSRTTSGMIFVDNGSNVNSMAPSYAGLDTIIDRVSLLSFDRIFAGTSGKVSAVEVTIHIRYHSQPDSGQSWCPIADINAGIAVCVAPTVSSARDIERSFRIILQNNLKNFRGAATPGNATVNEEQRMLGNIYFFRLLNPVRWN